MQKYRHISYLLALVLLTLLFSGCATTTLNVDTDEVETETTQLDESNLLDVGIILFDEGEVTDKQKEKKGLSEDVRAAESRYMAYHLKETMLLANGWGAIRVLPSSSLITDVHVNGKIISSDGEKLVLDIQVSDSTGTQWFEKTYKAEADDDSYLEIETAGNRDVYQYLYNSIANDIRKHRKTLTETEFLAIRNTTELRYAADISPNPFAEYVDISPNGQSSILRLPAEDDTMLSRVRKIREHEYLFIDAINEHYDNFYVQLWEPYKNWRKFYLIEAEQKRAVAGRATRTKALATLVMMVGLFQDPSLLVAGAFLYKSGLDISKEAEIHNEAIRELGGSLRAEVVPMVVEIEGRTVELTGSIEQQYEKWRKLLQEIYINETGFAFDETQTEADDSASLDDNISDNTVENLTEEEAESISL